MHFKYGKRLDDLQDSRRYWETELQIETKKLKYRNNKEWPCLGSNSYLHNNNNLRIILYIYVNTYKYFVFNSCEKYLRVFLLTTTLK